MTIDDDTKAISEETDGLNEDLAEAEKALRDLNLGVSGSVQLREDNETVAGWTQRGQPTLTFHRYAVDNWQLIVGVILPSGNPQFTPLRKAPRQLRVSAARALPALLVVLQQKADGFVTDIQKARQEAQAFTANIRKRLLRRLPPTDRKRML